MPRRGASARSGSAGGPGRRPVPGRRTSPLGRPGRPRRGPASSCRPGGLPGPPRRGTAGGAGAAAAGVAYARSWADIPPCNFCEARRDFKVLDCPCTNARGVRNGRGAEGGHGGEPWVGSGHRRRRTDYRGGVPILDGCVAVSRRGKGPTGPTHGSPPRPPSAATVRPAVLRPVGRGIQSEGSGSCATIASSRSA
jgi:hypothetical protein